MSIARAFALSLALALAAFSVAVEAQKAPRGDIGYIAVGELPAEARVTLSLIRKGGPYPYAKDGAVFGNREAILPRAKRGYYREYTVKTPGERTRGGRRIVAGRGGEYFYTDDHYNHFSRIRE